MVSRDKQRAIDLMQQRVVQLAAEEGLSIAEVDAMQVVRDEDTQRACGFSAYGYWLIERMKGESDGASILALWRKIAWLPAGSPIHRFKLRIEDFVKAEKTLLAKISVAG